ncbi:PAS domain S-box protein [Oscillatoria salina]|uniref:PAS domain S-box protein n=1 Tax=Oscillatoria salina TaxID=331517 RepID=UPI0013BA950D|nr:PAS domain S-box protein [Oscillatoria salina]MBZ8182124.1 PAS domain S-box protein [Oscillatoria salina IIICB1]NET87778.1 PAS domain S-box protein [Kamptonema sp. SIO1D9]
MMPNQKFNSDRNFSQENSNNKVGQRNISPKLSEDLDLEIEEANPYLNSSEKLYQIILNNISDTVLITDDLGNFTFICPNIEIIFGYSPQEVKMLRNISALLGEGFFTFAELKTNGEIRNIEQEITDKQGKKHTLLINLKRVTIEEGTILYSCRDISDRKKAENQLTEYHNRLEELVAERTRELSITNENLQKEISDRIAAEKALQDSEIRFRSLFERHDAIMLLIDEETGTIVNANRAAEKFYGYAQEILRQMTIFNLNQPLHEQNQSELFPTNCLNHNCCTLTQRGANAETRWVEIHSSPIEYKNKQLLFLIIHDISDRVETEAALRESEQRFRLLADTAPVLIWMSGTDALCNFFNKPWLDFTGRTLEEEIGIGWEENIHPSDRQHCLDVYLSAFNSRQSFRMEYRLKRFDGEYRWLLDTGVPRFTSTGTFAGYIGSCIDISDRKELEEALLRISKAVESSSEAIAMTEVTGRSIYHNPAFGELFKYTIEELNAAGGIAAIFSNQKEYLAIFYAIVKGKSWSGELTMCDRSGRKRLIFLHADAIKDQTGNIIGIVTVHTDISDRKRVEQELEETNKKLRRSIQKLETNNREICLLGEISEILQSCLSVEEAYSALADLVPTLFPGISGGVFILNESKNLVEAVATWGKQMDSKSLFAPCECWALRRGREHLVDTQYSGLRCQHLHGNFPKTNTFCVPTIALGETFGLLYLSSPKRKHFDDAKRHLAITFAEHIALALANLKLRETLHNQSIRDPLTGLFNRRYLEESLDREIQRAYRNQQTIGAIMIDIDHFKRFNDTFGHEAGDAVLRKVGDFLKTSIRSADIACRYGGEELILILPEASLVDSLERAEQIRQAIKHLDIQHGYQTLGAITVSLGVSCFPKHGTTSDTIIRAADAALYRAKAAGRDRVISA